MTNHVVLQGIECRIGLDFHSGEKFLTALAVGHIVIKNECDDYIEHVAEQIDKFAARRLAVGQFTADMLRDRCHAGVQVLAELLDNGPIQAFLAPEIGTWIAGRFTPARSAIVRVLAPSKPFAANSSSAASRMRARVSSPRCCAAGR